MSALPLLLALLAQSPDLVLADFEGADYGAWTAQGSAFGRGPARGTLPKQQAVSGFEGGGLVDTFLGGDAAQGTLTSPEFTLERRFVNFLLGGGDHPGETCVELVVGDEVVRSSTGGDDERLEWESWDVAELAGRRARIRIADRSSGGWGHVDVDSISLSDTRRAAPLVLAPLYAETWRPQFHFSSRTNWLNDPNGLVFLDGEYHLFFQHNPRGREWGNMSWGHAVSPDLVHWTQLDDALEPDALGTIYSGSAVVVGSRIAALYTAAGTPFTQCLAYSMDRGRTFTKFAKNPVLPHVAGENRDPKLVWHSQSARWVMALYLEGETYALFASTDLESWSELERFEMPGCSECPDFFEMPVEGESGERRWVFTAANGQYLVGRFDGRHFAHEGAPQRVEFGRNCYAVQSWSNLPASDGRRIQIGWMNGGRYPHMPFNQQMSLPCELRLVRGGDALHLEKSPVRELERLRARTTRFDAIEVAGRAELGSRAELLDLELEIEPRKASEVALRVRGESVRWSAANATLECLGASAPLGLEDGRLRLRVLVDRTSIEVYGNGGRVVQSSCCLLRGDAPLALEVLGGTARVRAVVHELEPAWKR